MPVFIPGTPRTPVGSSFVAAAVSLATGFAIPYGKRRLCDGELQMFTDSYARGAQRVRAVREDIQAELDAFLFYKLARDQARHWD